LDTSTELTLSGMKSNCCASSMRSITTGVSALSGPAWSTTAAHAEAHGQRADVDFQQVAAVGAQPLRAQAVEIEVALAQLQPKLRQRVVQRVAQRVQVDRRSRSPVRSKSRLTRVEVAAGKLVGSTWSAAPASAAAACR
jgi:hypothetical protein